MKSKKILTLTSLYFALSFVFITGCEKQKPGEEPSQEQIKQSVAENSTLDKLQGKWMSLDDAGSVIEFKGNMKTEYYNNQIMSTSEFEFLEKCKSGFSSSDVEGEYIDDGEICHKIEEVTDNTLMLIYMDRGNLLRYKRL